MFIETWHSGFREKRQIGRRYSSATHSFYFVGQHQVIDPDVYRIDNINRTYFLHVTTKAFVLVRTVMIFSTQ